MARLWPLRFILEGDKFSALPDLYCAECAAKREPPVPDLLASAVEFLDVPADSLMILSPSQPITSEAQRAIQVKWDACTRDRRPILLDGNLKLTIVRRAAVQGTPAATT